MSKSLSIFEYSPTNVAAMLKHSPELLDAVQANGGDIRKALEGFTAKPKSLPGDNGYAPALPVVMTIGNMGMDLDTVLDYLTLRKGGSEAFPNTMAIFNSEHADTVMNFMKKAITMLVASREEKELLEGSDAPTQSEQQPEANQECDCPRCQFVKLMEGIMGDVSGEGDILDAAMDREEVDAELATLPEDLQIAVKTVLGDQPAKDSYTLAMCQAVFDKYKVNFLHPDDSPTGTGTMEIDRGYIDYLVAEEAKKSK